MKFRIFKPAKSAMQSGKKNTQKWSMLQIEEEKTRSINPITGWTSASNTNSQLNYQFSTKEEAILFAQESGFEYVVDEPKARLVRKKSYTANFTG